MFGGTPICPRCTKAVYAAEQVMGPGRRQAYHKPCLACTSCNKRLDSYTLLEHDEQPYCKACHLKSFGTPNLRHNNLPVASPPGSNDNSPQRPTSPPTYIRPLNTGNGIYSYGNGSPAPNSSQAPRLQPNRTLTSPTSPTFSKSPTSPSFSGYGYRNGMNGVDPVTPSAIPKDEGNAVEDAPKASRYDSDRDTNTGRPGIGTIPRTVPLRHHISRSIGSVPSSVSTPTTTPSSASDDADVFTSTAPSSYTPLPPLMATPTGTRYGIALSGVSSHSTGGVGTHLTGSSTGGSPRKWGSGTPSCPRCGKSVYFAEQAKAVGKTYHKACLRCVDCGTTLDSHKLRDHDGQPYCVRCYQKAYGPQGNGYALLGKAGG
ncbi:hypothetical protein CPB83DRAFT_858587 [Crepidotus variabilis]|uniref:LIM zinc-binding domain-containing protein n=1 Tax=Crepidotus variabilis TaxID=179855 RepID=A0A9P6EBL3_9AGAR|nr:hypothetical protein CPB83DRAFT_858587 [Crepidotus variabilis]